MIDHNKLKEHTERWKGCQQCPLGKLAFKHVLHQLTPEDTAQISVLFIGEAPGEGEDAVGIPFYGRSGKLLRSVIEATNLERLPFAITNTVACRPVDKVGGRNRSPKPFEVEACGPRLRELMKILNPDVIVCLGQFSQKWTPQMVVNGKAVVIYDTVHPSLLLRTGGGDAPGFGKFFETIGYAFQHAHEMLEERA